jgi:autotransporter-associated beta strand protein
MYPSIRIKYVTLALICISIIAVIVWKFSSAPAIKAVATATTPAVTETPPADARPEHAAAATPLAANSCEAGTCGHTDHAQTIAIQPPRKVDLPLDFLQRITTGNKVAFDLPDGRKIACDEPRIEHDEKGIAMVSGTFTEPAPGSFFFRRQDFESVAGKMVGNVVFDGEKAAWKVLPEGPNGDPVLKEVPIDEVVCVNYSPVPEKPENPQEMPQDHPSTVALPEYQEVIPLQSLPGAPGTIYLDFDGSKGPHDTWSYRGDAAPSGFSNSTIRDIWIRVAEDFLPFNINVTTDARIYDNATRGRRIRCIITPTGWHRAGGVAYIGSYNWGGDPVCWSLNYTGDGAVTVISHEIGHTLGLYHHGHNGAEYYGGHGSGATSWAPIMGTGYGRSLKHWSDGSYNLATRPSQRDLTTITNQNGVDFRPDDCGETLATARYLWIAPGNTVTNQQGLIETPGEIDSYRFRTTGGAVNLTASTATIGINLDIKADLVNAATNAVVLTSDSTASANATLSTTLPAGEYLLRITGATVGTPATTRGGYSNYGCLGSYKIDGTVTGGETHQAFTIAENSPNGTAIGTVTPRTLTGSPLSYTIASGNTGGILALNSSTGALTVANSTALNFETLSSRYDVPAQFELFVTVSNTATSASETVRAIVAVSDLNEPPVLAAIPSAIAVYEGTTPGAEVVNLSATDPDRFDGPVYEIVSGNSAGHFAINSRTGALTVVNIPQVSADTTLTLVLRARDQRTPTQFSVNRTLTITLTDLPGGAPGTPGSITRTFFRNISGSAVTDLTGNANFPNRPSDEVLLGSFDGGSNAGDNYGSTLRGYLIPPATGTYNFWVAADNACQLILAPGATQASAPIIASSGTVNPYAWDQTAAQASAGIPLTAGQPYYIELRHKEASSGDHAAVAWSGPGIDRQVIPGLYLVPFYQNYAPAPSGTFTIMETAPVGTVVGTATVADVNRQDSHDTFTITAGNPGGLFAINPTTGQITVAVAGQFNASTTPFYNLSVRATDDGTPPLNGTGTVRVNIQPSQLYFDPNGSTPGSVANAASYAWRTTSWAATTGGTAAVANWIPNAQAIFAATTPPGPLAYDVDLAAYNSGTHGGFGAIRALAGTVRFVGNVDNFYLIGNTAVEAAPGAAIEFNQTRSGNALLAFNLNSQTVTFDGNVSFNNGGMGNSGNVVVNSGKLALNAANPYTGSTTVNGGTLSLLGSGALYTTLASANQTISLNPGTTLELDDWVGTNRSLGQLGYAAQNLVIDGATLRYTGLSNPIETNNGPGFTIGGNGATLESATTGQIWRILLDSRNASFEIASNGGPLVLTGSGDGSITKVIPGTDTALVKTGTGTWFLGATNTYGGGTTVSEGTLQCNSPGSLPGAVSVESNSSDEARFGTLFMNAAATTWSQNVSGSGLWKVATGSGSQTTVLSGDYTAFNGTLEVATGNGKIQLANSTRYPAAGSILQLNANTSLYLSGGGTLQSDIHLFGGTIGEPTFGQLRVGAANAILNGDVTLYANSNIAADSSRIATIHGVIGESGGSFGFTKNQPGTLVLTNSNTHTGGTTVNAGTLQTGTSTGKLGPGNLTVANGAICQIRNTTGALGRQAHVHLNGTGRLDLSAGVTERVSRLHLGGVLQAPGTYTAANLPANLSGAGTLVVGEVVPDAPANVTATLATWNAVRLDWSHIAVNDSSVRIERSLSPTSGFAEIANLSPGTSTYLDAGLAVLTPFHYRIRVSNSVGFSAYSGVASITTRAADPPANLTAVAGNAQVALTWSASDGASGYQVRRATESGGPYATVGTPAATSFTDSTAANGTTYFYIVLATALGAESDPSDEVSARPLPPSGSGSWVADSGGNWSDPENWQNFVVADGASNSASFGRSAGGTVTLDDVGRTLGTLNFTAGNYTLTGFPVALNNGAGTPLIDVASNRLAIITPLLSSTNGLRKTGGGSLRLAGGSDYTGSTSVDGGLLALGNAYAGSAYVIASGATLELDTALGDFSLPTTSFTGAGTLRKSGQNRAFWGTGVATFALGSGSLIEVTGGTLVGGSNANEVWTNNLSDLFVASGATFDGVEANVRVDGISGSGSIRTGFSGSGYTHLTIGVDNGSSTFDGVIADRSAAGNLRKEGSGTITLAGNNSFTGSVNIASGNLRITRSAGLGTGTKSVSINNSADKQLELDGSGGNITLGSGITYQTSGVNGVIRNIAGNNTLAGAITMTAGNGNTRITSDGGALTLSGSITANTADRFLDLGGSSTGNNTISGVIGASNAPAITKNGLGTWILSGNNAYTGSTTVSEGTLTLSGNRSTNLGGAISVGNAAARTATLNIQGDLPFAGQEFGVGSTAAGATGIVNHSAGLVSFSANNALLIGRSTGGVSGTYNLSGGELRTYTSTTRGVMIGVNSGASGNPITATFTLGGSGFLNNATGALQVVRSDAASSFQNSTYLQTNGTSNNGTLVIGGNGANGADSTATFTITGGTFTATTFGNLSRGDRVSSTLTLGGTADVTLPAFPTTRGTSSTATLYLDGGTLRPTAASASYLGGLTGALVRNGGANFDVPSTRDITVTQLLQADSGSTGGFSKSGPGTLTLTAANSYSGPTTVHGGTLVANTAARLGNGHLIVNTGAICDLRNPSGAVTDSSSVILEGSGRLSIASGVAETVARLYVNNAIQPAGTYTTSSHPALVSGTGSLVVTSGAPLAPTTLAATAPSHQTIQLVWSDNDPGESGYLVERSASSGGGFTQIASLPANSTSFSDTGLSANATWFYRVRAAGGSGNSPYSNVATATTLPTPPAAPTNPVATAGGFAVRLVWTAVPAATGYRIKRSTTSGSGFTEIAGTSSTSFIDGNLTPGIPVFYQIAAETSGSIGADSPEVTATPLAFVHWDGADLVTPGAQGGNGPWNSTALWWNGFANAAWPINGLTNEAVFAGNPGTVTLDPAGLAANRLTFNTNDYLLQNGPLTLNGSAPTIFSASNVTAQISSPISGSAGLTKSGPGVLILSGPNNYGITAIQQGLVQINHGGTLGTGSVTLGTGTAGTLGTLGNLTLNTDASVGTISIVSNTPDTSSPANIAQLLIASGRTLTASSLNAGLASSSAGNTRTALASGPANSGGTLAVNGSVVIGGSGSAGSTLTSVDLSGLSAFNLNAPSGHLRIGYGGLTKGTLTLATQSLLNTATLSVGETTGGANSSQFSTLNLGSGTTAIQTNDLRIGFEKTAGIIQFAGPTGSVSITGTNGIGKTAIAIGRATGGTYQGVGTNGLLLAGRSATVVASTVVVGRKGTGTSGGNITSALTFDTGTFTADSIRLADTSSGSASTSATGTFTFGTNSASTGLLTVNGDFTLASNTNSTNAQTASGTFIINGGTANITGAIKDASTSPLGTSNTTLTLDGGTLDMKGNPIGGDGTAGNLAIDNLNFRSGTLRNVSQINHGSTGLTKTTSGTLTLSGTHTYTGATTIAAGKLVLDGSITSNLTATNGTLAALGDPVITGDLEIPSPGTFEATPGVTLTASGNVTLAGALGLTTQPDLTVGDTFTLLEKTTPGPITGTFTGRPEASIFTAAGQNWQITYLGGDGNDVVVTVAPTSAINSWRQLHFGTTANTGNAADSFDANNDGESNLLEFATGQSPHTTTRIQIQTARSAGQIQFTYTRSKAAFDAGYRFTVEYTDTLAPDSWTSAGGGTVISDGPLQNVLAPIPESTAGHRFIRLKVVTP